MIDIYNITWRNVSDNLTPWFWRNITDFRPDALEPEWLVEYGFCIMNAFTNLTNRLFELAYDIENRLEYNGEVTIFEFALNDYFDSVQRRITITDAHEVATFDIYLEGETDPAPLSIYTEGEINPDPIIIRTAVELAGDYDFSVNVPAGISFNYNRMVQIINTYRQAGKRFIITTV